MSCFSFFWMIVRVDDKYRTVIRHIKFRRVFNTIADKELFFRNINIGEILHAGNRLRNGMANRGVLFKGREVEAAFIDNAHANI